MRKLEEDWIGDLQVRPANGEFVIFDCSDEEREYEITFMIALAFVPYDEIKEDGTVNYYVQGIDENGYSTRVDVLSEPILYRVDSPSIIERLIPRTCKKMSRRLSREITRSEAIQEIFALFEHHKTYISPLVRKHYREDLLKD